MLELYANIKARRKELGMTQSELAEILGYYDKSMICKIEHGTINLPQSRILAIAEALQTTASDLMGDDGTIPDDEGELLHLYRQLNCEGREKVTEYITDLIDSGKYKKHNKVRVVEKEA